MSSTRDALTLYPTPPSLRPAPFIAGVLSGKGGAGKTTTAAGLAATAGRLYPDEVLTVDADPRHGSHSIYRRIRKAGYDPRYICVPETDPAELARLRQSAKRIVFVDLPGNLDREDLIGPVAENADVIIIPSQVSSLDMEQAILTYEYLQDLAERTGRMIRSKVLITMTDPEYPARATNLRVTLNRAGIPVFGAQIRWYMVWRNCMRDGIPIVDYTQPGAGNARIDVLALFWEIMRERREA